ncbi:phosphoribosylanthranilate isomerase [Algoriphagus vanfongensis]|uniref:phosphoribosylanthranilate isomerase n=1 Tax=Algoriphagus vanfongensis TaxID=426371 RepID=UPI000408670D|nr:phosphoribosylanthranilate isomerase [Algoriphagus vanfongensis]
MALSTFVKIGGVTNLSDARYCAGMYVDVLGFDMEDHSEKFVNPTQFEEITGWVSGVEFAAEFQTETAEYILQKLEKYPTVSWIQHRSLEVLTELIDSGKNLIYEVNINEIKHLEAEISDRLANLDIFILLRSPHEKLEEDEEESILKISDKASVLLGSGITAFNVNALKEKLKLHGIALEGGEEIKPGLKDFDQLAEILEELELED